LIGRTDAVDRLRDLRLDPDPTVSRAATEVLDDVADESR
jgi:HEAT repeat protein